MLSRENFTNEAEYLSALRDWFAGQALAAISSMSGDGFSLSPEDEAAWAYQRADAMLKERDK